MKKSHKQFVQNLLALLILFLLCVGSVIASAPNVGVSPARCYKINGSTRTSTPQLDAGQIDFNFTSSDGLAPDPDQIPAERYQGCIPMQTSVSNIYELSGWAWNTNLGWISLSSTGTSAPYRNRGLDTGSQQYKSYIRVDARDGAGRVTDGKVLGYWWGDNMGWIRLNCLSSDPVNPGDVSQCSATNGNYGVSVGAYDVSTGMYNLVGYGWSDNLGWINLADVKVDLDSPTFAAVPYVTLLPSTVKPDEMYANGSSYYNIQIVFKDSSDINVTQDIYDSSPNYGFCVLFEDDRKIDATLNPPTLVPASLPTSCNGHLSAAGHYGTNLNLDYNKANSAASEFYYDSTNKRFLLKSANYVKSYLSAGDNELVLRKIKQTSSAGEWSYNAQLKFVNPFAFKMLPKSVSNVSSCVVSGSDALNLSFGASSPLAYCGSTFRGLITSGFDVQVSLPSISSDGLSLGLFTETEDGLVEDSGRFTVLNSSLVSNFLLRPVLEEGATGIDSSALNDLVASQGINSKVSYLAPGASSPVVRAGPTLEQIDLRVDQVAIRGGVEDRAFTQIKDDSGSSTSGGRSGTKSREVLLKNIFDLTGGNGSFGCTSGAADLPKLPGFMSSLSGGLSSSVATCKIKSVSEVYYVGFQNNERSVVHLSDLDGFFNVVGSVTPRVLILVGSDLIIDNDYTNETNMPAIVLLQNKYRKGGNVYITANVNDFRGYLFADKTIFSVDTVDRAENGVDLATGIPNKTDWNFSSLYSEIAFVGQFWSKNCVGCSLVFDSDSGLQDYAFKGDGTVTDIETARNYDVNFWRYSPLRYKFEVDATNPNKKYYLKCDGSGRVTGSPLYYLPGDRGVTGILDESRLCWEASVNGVPVVTSTYMTNTVRSGAAPSAELKSRSVNVVFKQAPKNMPIFGNL